MSQYLVSGEASILQINAKLTDISDATKKRAISDLSAYGIELLNFDIESINFPKEELEKIQETMHKVFEVQQLSSVKTGGAFKEVKSFEVLGDAAKNEGEGTVGSLLGAGIGLGAGLPVGQQIGSQIQVNPNEKSEQVTNQPASDEPEAKLKKLKSLFADGLITEEEYNNKRQKILDTL